MQLLPNLCFPEHPAPGSRLLALEAEWVTSAVIPLSLRHSLLCIHAFPALGMELVGLWFWMRDHVALGSFAGSLQPLQLYPMAKPLVCPQSMWLSSWCHHRDVTAVVTCAANAVSQLTVQVSCWDLSLLRALI